MFVSRSGIRFPKKHEFILRSLVKIQYWGVLGRFRNREVAYAASDHQGSNFEFILKEEKSNQYNSKTTTLII